MIKNLFLLIIIFFSSSSYVYSSSLEYYVNKGILDGVYALILNEIDKGNIRDSTKPFKIKYCKAKGSDETFTTLKHLPCIKYSYNQNEFDKYCKKNDCNYQGSTKDFIEENKISGKKISKKEFLKTNPDFSELNNLVCLRTRFDNDYRDYRINDVYFINHTPSNKLYLNSTGSIKRIAFEQGYKWNYVELDDVNSKKDWFHEGQIVLKDNTFDFRFWDKNGGRVYLKNQFSTQPNVKCYASDDYWETHYPNATKEQIASLDSGAIAHEKEKLEEKKKDDEILAIFEKKEFVGEDMIEGLWSLHNLSVTKENYNSWKRENNTCLFSSNFINFLIKDNKLYTKNRLFFFDERYSLNYREFKINQGKLEFKENFSGYRIIESSDIIKNLDETELFFNNNYISIKWTEENFREKAECNLIYAKNNIDKEIPNIEPIKITTKNSAVYSELNIPSEIQKKIGSSDPLIKSAREFYYRFITKRATLNKYPEKAIEGILWFEIYYNENLKNKYAIDEKSINSLLEIRNSLRNTIGIELDALSQDAIDYLWVMKILQENQILMQREIPKEAKDRIVVLNNLIKNLNNKNFDTYEEEKKIIEEINKISKTYEKQLAYLSKSNDPFINDIDLVLDLLNDKIKLTLNLLKKENYKSTTNALDFIKVSAEEVLETLPQEKILVSNNNFNIDNVFDKNQLEIIQKFEEENLIKNNEKLESFSDNIVLMEEDGFKSNDLINTIGQIQMGINKRTGIIQSYIKLKSIDSNTDLGSSTMNIPKLTNPYGIAGGRLFGVANNLYPKSLYYHSTFGQLDQFDVINQSLDDGPTIDEIFDQIPKTDEILPGFEFGEVDEKLSEINEGKDPSEMILFIVEDVDIENIPSVIVDPQEILNNEDSVIVDPNQILNDPNSVIVN